MNPTYLASFLEKLDKQSQSPEVLQWVSTHPDSKERVRYIEEKISLYKKSVSK
jgi:predicted Zn-dependent protease